MIIGKQVFKDSTDLFYPDLRKRYSFSVGAEAEKAIRCVFSDYEIKPHTVRTKGADVQLPYYNIAVEVWNHSNAHAYQDRVESVINNLSEFKHKFMVSSFVSKPVKEQLENEGIKVIELGYQITLYDYVEWYDNNPYDTMHGRKTSNKRTLKLIKNQLKPIFDVIEAVDSSNDSCYVYKSDSRIDSRIDNRIKHKASSLNVTVNPHVLVIEFQKAILKGFKSKIFNRILASYRFLNKIYRGTFKGKFKQFRRIALRNNKINIKERM